MFEFASNFSQYCAQLKFMTMQMLLVLLVMEQLELDAYMVLN